MSHIRGKTPHGNRITQNIWLDKFALDPLLVIDLIDRNDKWTVDKKKLQQTLYCKVVLKFWGFCFGENVVYKEVSMSILGVLATVCVTCSPTTSECN